VRRKVDASIRRPVHWAGMQKVKVVPKLESTGVLEWGAEEDLDHIEEHKAHKNGQQRAAGVSAS